MRKQSGNFLLQALLALTLVFAFLPFLAGKLSSRDMTNKLYSAKEIIDTAQIAARIYLTENIDSLTYKKHVYSDADDLPPSDKNFVKTLEMYGLPLGFRAKTIFNQNIDFIIDKTDVNGQPMVDAYLKINQGDMSKYQMAELARMIGFYAVKIKEGNKDYIKVYVPTTEEETEFQDIVLRNEPANAGGFNADLNMNSNNIWNVSKMGKDFSLTATVHGQGIFTDLTFDGSVAIDDLNVANNVVFRGTLETSGNITAFNILNGGNIGSSEDGPVTSISTTTADVSTLAGSNAALYAKYWDVKGGVEATKTTFQNIATLNLNGVTIKIPKSCGAGTNCDVSVETLRVSGIKTHSQWGENVGGGYDVTYRMDPSETLDFYDLEINLDWTGEYNGIISNNGIIFNEYHNTNNQVTACADILSNINNIPSVSANSIVGAIACKYIFLRRLERRIKTYLCFTKGVCS